MVRSVAGSDDNNLELEREWQEQKAAKQAAAAAEPPQRKRRVPLAAVLGGLAILGVVAAVVVVIAGEPPRDHVAPAPAEGAVAIEVLSSKPAAITIDGHKAGHTPLTAHVPKGRQPIVIEATIGRHTQTREVVPDHDQLVDFAP